MTTAKSRSEKVLAKFFIVLECCYSVLEFTAIFCLVVYYIYLSCIVLEINLF